MITMALSYIQFVCTEVAALKCCYVIQWGRMAMLNDEFCAMILTLANTIFSILLASIRIFTGEAESSIHFQFISGCQIISGTDQPFKQSVFFWWVMDFFTAWTNWIFLYFSCIIIPQILCGLVTAISLIVILVKKYRSRNDVQPFNNILDGKNTSILGAYGALVVIVMTILVMCPMVYTSLSKRSFAQSIAPLMYMMLFFVPSLLMPSFFFNAKPKLFKSAVDLFKEAAGIN